MIIQPSSDKILFDRELFTFYPNGKSNTLIVFQFSVKIKLVPK